MEIPVFQCHKVVHTDPRHLEDVFQREPPSFAGCLEVLHSFARGVGAISVAGVSFFSFIASISPRTLAIRLALFHDHAQKDEVDAGETATADGQIRLVFAAIYAGMAVRIWVCEDADVSRCVVV